MSDPVSYVNTVAGVVNPTGSTVAGTYYKVSSGNGSLSNLPDRFWLRGLIMYLGYGGASTSEDAGQLDVYDGDTTVSPVILCSMGGPFETSGLSLSDYSNVFSFKSFYIPVENGLYIRPTINGLADNVRMTVFYG